MIEFIVNKIMNVIESKVDKTPAEIAVARYGLFTLVQTIISVTLCVVTGLLLGITKEILIISFAVANLKRSTGGVHASSSNRCLIIGLFFTILLSYLDIFIFEHVSFTGILVITMLIYIITAVIVYKKAPVAHGAKKFKNPENRERLRKKAHRTLVVHISITILLYFLSMHYSMFNILTIAIAIPLGTLLQTFSLSHIGAVTIGAIDNLLKLNKKEAI